MHLGDRDRPDNARSGALATAMVEFREKKKAKFGSESKKEVRLNQSSTKMLTHVSQKYPNNG